jgi:hypothetical protein
LYEGKIWKCAPIAYLNMQKRKFRLSAKWDPYLQHEPLASDCDASALEAILRREDKDVCSMCPSYRREFAAESYAQYCGRAFTPRPHAWTACAPRRRETPLRIDDGGRPGELSRGARPPLC